MKNILILGGGYAGIMTALRLAGRLKNPNDVSITLINASDTFTERIRLHQVVAGDKLRQHSIPRLLRGRNIRFVQGWITALKPDQHQVQAIVNGESQTFDYDVLVYGLGSHTDLDSVPGVRDYAYTLDPKSAQTLRGVLPRIVAQQGTLLICGGGLTGIEAATEFASRFPKLNVRLVTQGELGGALSAKGREYILQTFARMNIQLDEHVTIQAVNRDSITLEDGRTIPHNAVVWAGSFNTPELAKQAGVMVNGKNQILIDLYLRSISHPDIFVVGDAGQFVTDPGAPIRMACATGMPIGVQGGENVAALVQDQPLKPFNFNYMLQCISLGRHNGLVQFVHGNDAPKERILKGRMGAWVKEMICRFTIWAMKAERRFPGSYTWAGAKTKKQAISHEQSYGNI